MIRAFVPSFHQVQDHGKEYTVFQVAVFASGKCHRLDKRYSAFHNLHKQLKRVMQTPYFPPKRVRNSNPKFLEQRRLALENYLQMFTRMRPIPKQVLVFLSLPHLSPSNSSNSLDATDTEKCISHQPVLTFVSDAYCQSRSSGTLPDIIVQGVTLGLYSDDDSDS